MSDQESWAQRSVCCNCIHPRDPDLLCWTTKNPTANPDAALLGRKADWGEEDAIGWLHNEKQRPQETWRSSEVSVVHRAIFQQLMILVEGELFILVAVTVEKRPVWNDRRQGFFYPVLYDEGEENRMRWRSALREAWSRNACQGELYTMSPQVGEGCRWQV